MDRLRTMSVFVAVAEEGGFAAAARHLSMSPPSVSRAVYELEAHLGARLFHRTTRSVRLTEAGERYLADGRRILAEIEEADRQAAGVHGSPQGEVTVSAPALFGPMVVAPILLDLLDRYSQLSVTTVFVDRLVHLMDEGIDVAVRIAELPDSSLSSVRVGAVRRVLCAAPAYLDAHGTPQTPKDLADHDVIDCVGMTPGGEWRFAGDSRQVFRPNARLRADSAGTAIAAAVAARGITRVLSYTIASEVEVGTLVTVLQDHEPPPVPVHVIHKEPGRTSMRVRAVFNYLVEGLRTRTSGLGHWTS